MNSKNEYVNGQKISEQKGNVLTYFFKDGTVKAEGVSLDGLMQGEWKFYRESGQLWQVGHFKDNEKHGEWIRYSREGQVEYHRVFENGKLLKK